MALGQQQSSHVKKSKEITSLLSQTSGKKSLVKDHTYSLYDMYMSSVKNKFAVADIKSISKIERILHKGTNSYARPLTPKHVEQFQKATQIALQVTATSPDCYGSPPITEGINMDKVTHFDSGTENNATWLTLTILCQLAVYVKQRNSLQLVVKHLIEG